MCKSKNHLKFCSKLLKVILKFGKIPNFYKKSTSSPCPESHSEMGSKENQERLFDILVAILPENPENCKCSEDVLQLALEVLYLLRMLLERWSQQKN